jgi:predicted permease
MDDIRYAFRSLRKQPGFAVVAVLTLAFGIGVNVSLFSLISAFFLQPLQVKDPHELVVVMQRGDIVNIPYGHSYPDYLDYRAETKAFSSLAAYMMTPVHLSARGETSERTWIEVVSPNYFDVARVSPAFGEFPRLGDSETTGGAPSAVLSYRYWQRRFGGDPSIVGRAISLNGRTFTVTGIAPASFTGLSWAVAVSAFVPSGAIGTLMDGGDKFRDNRGTPAWRVMGRLAPGRTIAEARAELEVAAKRLADAYPDEHKGSRILLIPENRARPDPALSDFVPIFAAVFAAMVALVLLIACANVANLMLARAAAGQRDLVIRSALGASRFRLIRLQVVESLILASAAGVLAILLAQWAGEVLAGFAPSGDIPVNQDRGWDWRVYAFSFGVACFTGIATGLWPARKATQFGLVESLKQGGSVAGSSRHRLRNLLVVGQVTMSLVVLVASGLFLHSLRQLQTVGMGFRSDGLLMVSLDLGLQQYTEERGRRFLDDLLTRAEALPGVESATVLGHVPFDYGMQLAEVSIDGEIVGSKDGHISAAFNIVGPKYFETAGAVIARGRGFDRTDERGSRRVAIVNETMARTLWPDGDAIGRRFKFGWDGAWMEVVGVARDGKYLMLGEDPRPYFYMPLSQKYSSPITVMVRSASDPLTLARPLQGLLREMDADLPLFNVRTMDDHVRESVLGLMPMRMGAAMAGVQGVIAVFLAVMGLYAVVSYAVSRRTREIGVRMALGAGPADVLRLVVREGMRLSFAGLAIGLLIALGGGFALSKVLYGVKPVDLVVFGSVTALLVTVSALACYLPARKATRVDPLVALRAE